MQGLTNEEKARLILSVGKGGTGGYRPLPPAEVAGLLRKSLQNGDSVPQLASELTLGVDMIGRFLRLLELPETLQSLASFKSSSTTLSFSAVSELARLENPEEQEYLAKAALENNLTKSDVQQVIQRRIRSKDSIESALKAILALRPTIVRRHVIIGAIQDAELKTVISAIPQQERDQLGKAVASKLGTAIELRVTPTRFTMSGNESAAESLRRAHPNLELAVENAIRGLLK